MKKLITILSLAFVAGSVPAMAQSKAGFYADFSLVGAVSETKTKITGKTFAGYQIGFSYLFPVERAGLDMRAHLEFATIDGQEGTTFTKKNLTPFAGVDIYAKVGKFGYFGGPLVARWNVDNNKNATKYPATAVRSDAPKFGYRFGMDYDVLPNLAVMATFAQAEFNTNINPSMITLGVNYRF